MPKNLPVVETVLDCYRLTFVDLLYGIKISWHWFCLMMGIGVLTFVTLSSTQSNDLSGGNFVLGFIAMIVIYALAWLSIAVLWHRRLLLGESRGFLAIELGERSILYFWRFILIGLIAIVATLPFIFIQGAIFSGTGSAPMDEVLTALLIKLVIFSLIIGLVGIRFGIALSAAAVDHKKIGLRAAWKASAGGSLRIITILILISLPIYAIGWIASMNMMGTTLSGGNFEFGLDPVRQINPLLHYVREFASLLSQLFLTLLYVTLLSICYAFFVDNRRLTTFSKD